MKEDWSLTLGKFLQVLKKSVLKKDITVSCNARIITFDDLKNADKDFWDICEAVRDKWNQYYVKR